MFTFRLTIPGIAAAAAAAATAVAAVALTGCGSSPSPTAARPSATAIQQFERDAVRFSDCIRAHGVSDFPDAPTASNPNSGRVWKNALANPGPGLASAVAACQHFMPADEGAHDQSSAPTSAQFKAMLAFAKCIRARGFVNFPDPTTAGITHQMLAAAGINLTQPALRQAADACASVTHGYITAAVVARFIAGN